MDSILSMLDEYKLTENIDKTTISLTLLALYILREVFDDRKDEWELLAKKAKEYLKQIGLPKADSIVSKF